MPEHMHAAVEWPSIERRLHFGALTDIRVDSDACVDDSCCLFLCQDTSPSTYFCPLSQLAFGPASTYEGWAADVDLTVPETCCFSWQGTSISNSHLDLLLISPRPIAQRREAYIYNSKNERFFPASIGSACFTWTLALPRKHCAQPQRAASARAASAGDSLATESTGTILVPRQMSKIAGHGSLLSSSSSSSTSESRLVLRRPGSGLLLARGSCIEASTTVINCIASLRVNSVWLTSCCWLRK